MEGLLKQLTEWVGLGAAFSTAASVYLFFYLADKRASKEAREAISSWIRPLPYDAAALNAALVEVFDRLYSKPLWSVRAFGRSAVVTVVVTFCVALLLLREEALYYVNPMVLELSGTFLVSWFLVGLLANILSDYVSLFVVRRWLLVVGVRPMRALLGAAVIGMVVVLTVLFLKDVVLVVLGVLDQPWNPWDVSEIVTTAYKTLRSEVLMEDFYSLFWGSLAVHLWLPLFALGILTIRLLNWFVQATGWMQWYLEGGRDHPLQSVGYVAAGVVFVVAAVGQWAWR